MKIKIGVNGMGRIGRMIVRSIVENNFKNIEIKHINKEDKKIIIEALWDIIYSDEDADMYETNLMRRLSGLLYLDPKVVGDIKEKVRQKKI